MRLRFLTWFLFISCTQAISNSGLHRNLSSNQRELNSSTSNVLQIQPPSVENYGSTKEEMRLHREDEVKQELPYASVKKAHGGKGSGGGTNVDHTPRRSVNSTPSLLSWSSTVSVSLASMLMLPFQFKLL